MIYAFYADRPRVVRQVRRLEETLRARAPEAPVRAIDAQETSPSELEELVGAQGLFYERTLVRVSNAWDTPEWRNFLAASIPALAADANLYILWSGVEPPKTIKELLATHAQKVVEIPVEKEKPVVHAFAVGRLWCEGKRAQAWAELQRALLAQEAPEQIAGALLWQLRAALAYAQGAQREVPRHALAAAKAALERWGAEGVRERQRRILAAYHAAHQGDTQLAEELELLLLEHPTFL